MAFHFEAGSPISEIVKDVAVIGKASAYRYNLFALFLHRHKAIVYMHLDCPRGNVSTWKLFYLQ